MAPLFAIGLGLLMTATGTLQWLLVRRLLGPWDRLLAQPGLRGVLRFGGAVLVGGVLAPSLGVPVLVLAERVAAADALGAGFTWWVGDVTGMLMLTPPLMLLLVRGGPRQTAFGQAFPAISVGVGLTLLCSYLVGQGERAGERQRAEAELRTLTSALQAQVELAESDLRQLAALHLRSGLSDAEFTEAADRLRQRHAWLSSLSYLRRLPDAQRSAYEQARDLDLNTLAADGSLVTAPPQPEYWVTERLSPRHGLEARLGVDDAGEPVRRAAIELALRSGDVSTSAVLDNLGLSQGEALAVALYAPVHEDRAPSSVRADNATGLVSAGLQLQSLLASALAPFDDWHMPLLLVSDGPSPRGLAWREGRFEELQAESVRERLASLRKAQALSRSLTLGQRPWQLLALPESSGYWLPSVLQGATLGVGFVFTGLLGAMLVARARRDAALRRSNAELEREVEARTLDLAQRNEELKALTQSLSAQTEALARREAVLNAVLRSLPDPLWVKDSQGHYLELNPALERALNRRAEDLIGRGTRELFSEADAALDDEADQRTRQGAAPFVRLQKATDAQGRLRTYQVTRSNVRLEDGTAIGLVGLARDITDDLAREDELRRFRWLAESASQGFALGQLDGRVDYLNGVAQRWLGEPTWPPQGPRQARDYYDDDGLTRLRHDVMPALRTVGHWTGEMPLRGLPGAPMPPVLVSYFMLHDEEGHERAVAMTLTDLSEQHRMEHALADARDRAEAANRAKSVFLANMSHEIRTPLNAVLGYAQLLREQRDLPSSAQAQVASILSGGQRLLRLINDVLDLSKIEAGALQLSPEPYDVRRELEEALRLMGERARRAEVTLEGTLDTPQGVVALGDRIKLGQVLLNLLGNAIKFTPAGGRVGLTATLAPGDVLQVHIQDTGPGIAAEELAQLFTPFVQGRSGMNQGGTGLGLVLSRNLLRAMGGDLVLESQPGVGTRATLTLPLQRVTPAEPHPTLAAPTQAWRLAPDQGLQVLVAEDDPDSRHVLCELLTNLGVTVWSASDGEDALALAQQHAINLVLTDLRMPRRDGVALMQALKADPARRHWPVVAVTASSLVHERDSYLAMGFADYVAKPYEFQRIVDVIRQLTQARWQSREAEPASLATPSPAPAPASESQVAVPWSRLLGWADDGDVVALRDWCATEGPRRLSEAFLHTLREALSRYDFERVTACLMEARGSPPQGSE